MCIVHVHDEYYRTSLLKHFDQYQLPPKYGGMAHLEYDLNNLKNTETLEQFIESYIDPS